MSARRLLAIADWWEVRWPRATNEASGPAAPGWLTTLRLDPHWPAAARASSCPDYWGVEPAGQWGCRCELHDTRIGGAVPNPGKTPECELKCEMDGALRRPTDRERPQSSAIYRPSLSDGALVKTSTASAISVSELSGRRRTRQCRRGSTLRGMTGAVASPVPTRNSRV